MEVKVLAQFLVYIQTDPVTAAEVLKRPGNVIAGARLDVEPVAEVAAKFEAGEILNGSVQGFGGFFDFLPKLDRVGGRWCRAGNNH